MSRTDEFFPTGIHGVLLRRPRIFRDERGSFRETWNRDAFAAAGICCHFVQDNCAVSATAGTVRGLHFQIEPMAQAKLIYVLSGAILDVAVDLRAGSPTYGRHVAARLTPADGEQLFIPSGFAHGYCTLEDNTVVGYKVGAFWSPEHERGLAWNDPALAIPWPVSEDRVIIAERDRHLPRIDQLKLYWPA